VPPGIWAFLSSLGKTEFFSIAAGAAGIARQRRIPPDWWTDPVALTAEC
jgi:hypothetical protein